MKHFSPNEADQRTLVSLAEFRALTANQLALLHDRNPRATERRLKILAGHEFVEAATPNLGRPGRPERVWSLGPAGVKLLRGAGEAAVRAQERGRAAVDLTHTQHLLTTNWFWINLLRLAREMPDVTVRFLPSSSSASSGQPGGRFRPAGQLLAEVFGDGDRAFLPDGVFGLTHRTVGKTLLFVLEVDCGTERLNSRQVRPQSIRGKIANYQDCFRSGRYKRCERAWNCALNGFRALFLAESASRLTALCRLVEDSPPSDFVWLTDLATLLDRGPAARIWARGGHLSATRHSILGSKAPAERPASTGQ